MNTDVVCFKLHALNRGQNKETCTMLLTVLVSVPPVETQSWNSQLFPDSQCLETTGMSPEVSIYSWLAHVQFTKCTNHNLTCSILFQNYIAAVNDKQRTIAGINNSWKTESQQKKMAFYLWHSWALYWEHGCSHLQHLGTFQALFLREKNIMSGMIHLCYLTLTWYPEPDCS